MAELGDVRIHYEISGEGFPVLLLAPGGMRSAGSVWGRMAWDPRVALADQYQVIAMDQRNAGDSTAPVAASNGWSTYAADQLALLDHLGIDRCHTLGMCIGGSFVVGLATTAPERVTAAVAMQPVGIDNNRETMRGLFDSWRDELADRHPEADSTVWDSYKDNMWNGDFLLAASRHQVAACPTPLLVFMGDDEYHPQSVSRELAERAPNAALVEHWKDEVGLAALDATVKQFLAAHTP
ncbi:MAG: alpha/beta hydrolase [Acidimicrobiia bacterium]|nr:alpha/beta hydrolase [Acidimicrobiia bacterium]